MCRGIGKDGHDIFKQDALFREIGILSECGSQLLCETGEFGGGAVALEADCPPCPALLADSVIVGSGLPGGACEEVDGLSAACVLGPVLSG